VGGAQAEGGIFMNADHGSCDQRGVAARS